MPNSPNVAHADGAGIVLQKWFSGRNIHATAASRSYINFDLAPGDLLVMDPYSNTHDSIAIGMGLALPTALHLHLPHFVVVNGVHPDVNVGVDASRAIDLTGASSGAAVNARRGGWIDVCPLGVVSAFVEGGTDIVVGDPLVITIGTTSAGLVTRASLRKIAATAITDATLDGIDEITKYMASVKGIALEAYTATDLVTKKVAFGPMAASL